SLPSRRRGRGPFPSLGSPQPEVPMLSFLVVFRRLFQGVRRGW
ncbi:MAG: hypothetical protein H6R33_767, partial [Actinobacteria bacterium]|nr:hypothetical protein [Actinomycetota bacterium]